MNDRKRYYPVVVYTVLLLLVWVVSLANDLLQLFYGNTVWGNSLISAGGVRWAVRNALPSIAAAPWSVVVVSLAIVGLLRSSGIAAMLSHLLCRFRLSKSELRALLFSLLALLPYSVILYMATVSPWNLLQSVTGDISISPIGQGWLFLLFIGVLFVSLIYGFIYGCYRSLLDAVVLTGDTFAFAIPAVLSIIPASGIVPCLQYIGAFDFLGFTQETQTICEWVLYVLPFLYLPVRHRLK